jgi:hypothetical protein
METRISFPSGAVGPGMTPPFLVASLRPGQGGVTGYGNINVSAMPNNQRVGPVRSPIGPVHGYRDQTHALGPVAYVPTNIPGPIYPGVGPGSWHVGPTIMRDGRLPFGTYSARMQRKDAHFRTYGVPDGAKGGVGLAAVGMGVAIGVATGALSGGVAGMLLSDVGARKGAKVGAVSALIWTGIGAVVSLVTGSGK